MKVTITPLTRPDQAFSLTDGYRWDAWRVPVVYGLEDIDGWIEGVAPVFESEPIPQGHGTYHPDRIFLDERVLTVRGGVRAMLRRGGTSLDISRFDDLLASLVGEDVEILVEDASGVRRAEGYVSAQPTRDRLSEWSEKFSLIITCPDPLKYGSPVLYPVTGGAAVVQNAGTGDVWPRVLASGRVRSLTVTFDGRRVAWTGNSATGLVLDLRTAIPLDGLGRETGLLSFSQVFRVPPGESRIVVDSDASVQVEVTPGWK